MSISKLRLTTSFAAMCFATAAVAVPVTFTGTSGVRSASVSFDIVGGNLQVVLSNTSSSDSTVPTDILTAVFFNIVGNPSLTRISAISGGPTYIVGGAQQSGAGANVGTEWGYTNNVGVYGANEAIGSAGFGIFGPPNVFAGSSSPGGVDYGLASAGDVASSGNGGLQGRALTRSSDTFTLGGLPADFTLASIGAITFQYGTALDEPSVRGSGGSVGPAAVPEPDLLALLGIGFVITALARRKRR